MTFAHRVGTNCSAVFNRASIISLCASDVEDHGFLARADATRDELDEVQPRESRTFRPLRSTGDIGVAPTLLIRE